MSAVRISGGEDEPNWTNAARVMLDEPRAIRDIAAYPIERTAHIYLELA